MRVVNKENQQRMAQPDGLGARIEGSSPRLARAAGTLICACAAWAAPAVHGVILYGTGDPAANTQAPAGALAGSGWEFQGLWGSFLGTPVAPSYFLTAKHVGGTVGQKFTFNGVEYPTVASFPSPTSDLQLWKVAGTFPAYAPLYAGGDEVGKNLVVFGRGTQRGAEVFNQNRQLAGWQRGAADGRMRWGENVVDSIFYGGSALGYLLRVSFDRTGGPNEAMLSTGDSGGGLFVQEGGVWKLAGICYGVDGPFNTSLAGDGFFGAMFDKGGLYEKRGTSWHLIPDAEVDIPGNFGATRVSEHVDWITAITGIGRAQTTHYVNVRATGTGTGADWANAFPSLQTALQQAKPGDEIWVAAGTYLPDQPGQPLTAFELKSGVALYGGFSGTETQREQRDPVRLQTILSGDLNGDDGINWANTSDNSRHVVRATGIEATAVLDGFTITGGSALGAGPLDNAGGGLLLQDANVWLLRCRIEVNHAQQGGGLYVSGGSVSIDDCVVRGNAAEGNGGGWASAKGLAESRITLRDCVILGNTAGRSSAGNGGGGYVDEGNLAELWHCSFNANRALSPSNVRPAGGGLAVNGDEVKLIGCLFANNDAGAGTGGGLSSTGLGGLALNCVFNGNRAFLGAAAANSGGVLGLVGCTMSSNRADQGGGLSTDANGHTRVRNSIIWANAATAPTAYASQVHEANGGATDIAFSCVQGLQTAVPGKSTVDLVRFPGCVDADPGFVNLAGRNYQLLRTSPCVNSGSNQEAAVTETDFAGKPRIINGTADMGAYEHGSTYAWWAQSHFTQQELSDPAKETTVWGPGADPDRDGRSNLLEYAVGSDPTRGANTEGLQTSITESGLLRHHQLTVHRRLDDLTLEFVVEVSSDGQVWASSPDQVALAGTSSLPDEPEFALSEHRDLTPVSPGNPRIIRLRVIQN